MTETIIRQIPVSNCTVEEYRQIVTKMANEGYEISNTIKDIKDGEYITAILIDNAEKKVFQMGVKVTAIWCGGSRYPLNGKQFFRYYDKLITNPDIQFYEKLICTDPNNKSGQSRNISIL